MPESETLTPEIVDENPQTGDNPGDDVDGGDGADPATVDAPVDGDVAESASGLVPALVDTSSPVIEHAAIEAVPGWREMQGLAAMAVTLSAANALPAALQGKPNDVFLVLLTARELGIAPTSALRGAYVVNGNVTLAPKLRAAIVRQRGIGRLWPDAGNDRTKATWYGTRADEHHEVTYAYSFTIEDAQAVKETKWTGSGNNRRSVQSTLAEKDNWTNYPQRMLSWRALGYLLDDAFPEVGTGLYSPDELGAVTDEEGTPVIDVASTEPLPGTNAPRGHNQPPPDVELWSDFDPEAFAALGQRIERISKSSSEGEAALRAMWTEQVGEPAAPRLPPLRLVTKWESRKAIALVESIEKRVGKGEWGDESAAAWRKLTDDATSAPDEAPSAPESGSDAHDEQTVVEAPADAQETPQPVSGHESEPLDPQALMERVIAEVKGMRLAAVSLALEDRKLSTAGNPDTKRSALAAAIFHERNGTSESGYVDEDKLPLDGDLGPTH